MFHRSAIAFHDFSYQIILFYGSGITCFSHNYIMHGYRNMRDIVIRVFRNKLRLLYYTFLAFLALAFREKFVKSINLLLPSQRLCYSFTTLEMAELFLLWDLHT
jgi:hypothetical protein